MHIFFEKSLMNITKYLIPTIDSIFIGLQTFECIISNNLLACVVILLVNEVFYCLPWIQTSQASIMALYLNSPRFKPFTMDWNFFLCFLHSNDQDVNTKC